MLSGAELSSSYLTIWCSFIITHHPHMYGPANLMLNVSCPSSFLGAGLISPHMPPTSSAPFAHNTVPMCLFLQACVTDMHPPSRQDYVSISFAGQGSGVYNNSKQWRRQSCWRVSDWVACKGPHITYCSPSIIVQADVNVLFHLLNKEVKWWFILWLKVEEKWHSIVVFEILFVWCWWCRSRHSCKPEHKSGIINLCI